MPPKFRGSQEIPQGGSANAYGVLYQMLWSVFQAQKQAAVCEILEAEPDETGQDLRSVTFMVEPRGGGDLARGKIVEQIKSRPSGTPWKFEEVIAQVLPDLYRAAAARGDYEEYQFITEGRTTVWKKIGAVFCSLAQSPPLQVPIALDDQTPLITPQEARALGGPATTRRIFDHVVTVIRVIRGKVAGAAAEPLEVTQRRVWHLLSHFQVVFRGESGQSWALFRLAYELDRVDELVLLFRSKGSVESDCELAAQLFCRDIWGHGYEISLPRLTERLRGAIQEARQTRITLCIEGVLSESYADELIRYPWEDLGLRLAISFQGSPEWNPADAGRCRVIPQGPLSEEDLAVLLAENLGPEWVFIPSDVRRILTNLLSAHLYLEEAATRHG
jgi:hypothetical protein